MSLEIKSTTRMLDTMQIYLCMHIFRFVCSSIYLLIILSVTRSLSFPLSHTQIDTNAHKKTLSYLGDMQGFQADDMVSLLK